MMNNIRVNVQNLPCFFDKISNFSNDILTYFISFLFLFDLAFNEKAGV